MNNFTDLVLLIGTNPLPNYVVAEYFVINNKALKNIWLVHSEEKGRQVGTNVHAENLEKVLRNKHSDRLNFPLQKVALSNVSSADQICKDLKDKFFNKLTEGCDVHLNYTGGTKAMGIHVYRAVEKMNTKIFPKSYSYLDGRNFQIVDDVRGVITDDLRGEVSISFKELIELHGFKRVEKESKVDFSEAINIFNELIKNGTVNGYFQKDGGYKRTLFEDKDDPGSLAKKSTKLKDELKKYVAKDVFLSVVQAMPEGYRLFDEKGGFVVPSDKNQCERAIEFLDGIWLEKCMYKVLRDNLNGTEVFEDWVIKKECWETDFQIDVVLLKGYQLIGVSCTTSDEKPICKSKGFEIIHRCRQIGGDEAKAILITRYKEKKILQKELELNTGVTSGNILVLGRDDLIEDEIVKKVSDSLCQD